MRLYLDTEFNGHGGELISMALVGAPVKHSMAVGGFVDVQWYAAQLIKGPIDPWVAQNVMPRLETPLLMPALFRSDFHDWIRNHKDPEIICDWHADAEHFCRMLAGPNYGESLDFPCRITILNTPPGQPVSAKPHNALADAVALRDWHLHKLAA